LERIKRILIQASNTSTGSTSKQSFYEPLSIKYYIIIIIIT